MKVENLRIGDVMLTAAGVPRPVKWIGRRSNAGRFLMANPRHYPIRFRAGALGDGLPRADLLVSAEHAMFIDNVLVPAELLVNGEGIVRDNGFARVDYYHVELETHDVLLAEGAASESFLDDNSRGLFSNCAEFRDLYPGVAPAGQFCAPRVDRGYELEAIRQKLARIGRVMQAA